MNKYTVLVLRPDYIADTFGMDTYLAHVTASTPRRAVTMAQKEAANVDGSTGPAYDYYPLIVVKGHHDDLTPDDER